MPAIRDGRGVLHVHDMGVPPPGSANGPVERRFVAPDVHTLPPPARRENDAALMAQSRARGAQRHVELVRAKKPPREEPVPPREHAHGDRATESGAVKESSHRTASALRERDARARQVADALTRFGGDVARAARELGMKPHSVALVARATAKREADQAPVGPEAVSDPVRNIPEPIPAEYSPAELTPPIEADGLPCDACAHAVVCSIKAELADWLADVPLPTPPHSAIHVLAKVLVTCDHYLEIP